MVMKIKKIVEGIRIIDAGAEGKAVGKIEDKVVFVPFVVPGDLIDAEVFKNKKSYYEGTAVRIHEYSDKRTEARCEHFGICGGCRWQNLKYSEQLYFKQKQVQDNIDRIGKFEHPPLLPIIPSEKEFFYRNKLEFSFSNKKWLTEFSKSENVPIKNMNGLGFHVPGMFDRVVDIRNCHLQAEPSNQIRIAVKKYAIEHNLEFFNTRNFGGFLRNLIVRTTSTGEVMVILIVHSDDQDKIYGLLHHIGTLFPDITSLMYVINSKRNDTINDLPVRLFKGKDHLVEVMGNLKFRIGPVSFFQSNTPQAENLFSTVLQYAELSGKETVYDFYTGTGTIANYIARKAHKVIGIESVPAALEDARLNSQLNGIHNTFFHCGDIAGVMSSDLSAEFGKPDVIITDPPRAGMHEKVVQQILNLEPARIVYISCNPATQARDVALMIGNYSVDKIQPFDMFPQTQHVENIMLLRRR
jgi:23S rRNA (uracil1939-C5)-methyltransferase